MQEYFDWIARETAVLEFSTSPDVVRKRQQAKLRIESENLRLYIRLLLARQQHKGSTGELAEFASSIKNHRDAFPGYLHETIDKFLRECREDYADLLREISKVARPVSHRTAESGLLVEELFPFPKIEN